MTPTETAPPLVKGDRVKLDTLEATVVYSSPSAADRVRILPDGEVDTVANRIAIPARHLTKIVPPVKVGDEFATAAELAALPLGAVLVGPAWSGEVSLKTAPDGYQIAGEVDTRTADYLDMPVTLVHLTPPDPDNDPMF